MAKEQLCWTCQKLAVIVRGAVAFQTCGGLDC